MKTKILSIEYPVRYDAAISCEAFHRHARVTYRRSANKTGNTRKASL
jgi:hypothetical protein